jgi:osmoprotectant transport system ATP-binding protein
MISLQAVRKSYDDGETFAVDRVELEIEAGELIILLGESGCGKTTTLKMINRLIEPSGGAIKVDGQDVQQQDPVLLRRHIGYVFQGIGLFPHMTIAQNVAVVPQLLGWSPADIASRIEELLELVHLAPAEFRHRLPRELSGGQRQRIGVARALAARPKIMLMDEAFGALDPLTRDALQTEYRGIHDELGLTSVMVTHDMTEALLMADRIAVMHNGRILQIGTPHELLTKPADDYVRRLMDTPKRHADRLESLIAAADSKRGADDE